MAKSQPRALLLTLTLVLLGTLARLHAANPPTNVITLTRETFNAVIAKERLVFVKFCDHRLEKCQMLSDAFSRAADKLVGTAKLADVDVVEHALVTQNGIADVPTVKVFANGDAVTDYKGRLDKDSLISFAHRVSIPPYTDVRSRSTFDKYVAANTGKTLLIAVQPDSALLRVFKRASFNLIDAMPALVDFALVHNVSAARHFKFQRGSIYLMKAGEDVATGTLKFETEDSMSFEMFVWRHALPVFSEFNDRTMQLYATLSIPVVLGFFQKCAHKNCRALERIAHKRQGNGRVAFAWADPHALDWLYDHMTQEGKTTSILAYSFKTHLRFTLPSHFRFSESALLNWVDDLIAGRVSAARKSQLIPLEQTGAVHIVVGQTWVDDVEQARRDVLVAQLMPWCKRSIRLEKVLDDVAYTLRQHGVRDSQMRIAKMDASENDPTDDYVVRGHDHMYDDDDDDTWGGDDMNSHGFPVLHFFAAGKAFGMQYEGAHSVKAIVEFLMKKAIRSFSFDTSALDADEGPVRKERRANVVDEARARRVAEGMEKWKDLTDEDELLDGPIDHSEL